MGVETGGREREREKTEIGLLVCCASLCCEHVIRLKMSLVQSGNPQAAWDCGDLRLCIDEMYTSFWRVKKAESLQSSLEASLYLLLLTIT